MKILNITILTFILIATSSSGIAGWSAIKEKYKNAWKEQAVQRVEQKQTIRTMERSEECEIRLRHAEDAVFDHSSDYNLYEFDKWMSICSDEGVDLIIREMYYIHQVE